MPGPPPDAVNTIPGPATASSSARGVSSAATTVSGVQRLRRYAIDPGKIFVAGISSGGFFGVQMHVAYSRTFKGAAIYAGGVYACAQDSVYTALLDCGGAGLYQSTLAASEAYLDAQSAAGTIDDKVNLRGDPVYLWSGTADSLVKQQEMNDLQTEYQHYGARIVRYDNAFPAQHGWESPAGELACGTLGSPFMIACNAGAQPYDSERVWMEAFFGRLHPRNDGRLRGALVNFDQTEFGAGATNSMDTNGYVFVPKQCENGDGRCGLVVAFHGCLQTQADIGTKFVTESGIDEWADTNGVVVLYPYAVKSATVPFNPQGCWDWWGYDDPSYALKAGTQSSIVYKMVQRLAGDGDRDRDDHR
ncbi:MAG TPA: PHB depolymerase family esterase [Candidatus Elarobacter sp.]|nr:PHB depolymerase family esterase [Candidatus Elarobacter sp.]